VDRFYPVSLVVPLATQPSGPITQAVTLENALLVAIEVDIPPGHAGFTGLRVRSSRQQIFPWGITDWLIADNYTNTFPVNEEIGSKSISLQAYNTDVYPHTFYIRFHIVDLPPQTSGTVSQSTLAVAGAIVDGAFDNMPTLPEF
jgi:hypothetical protein